MKSTKYYIFLIKIIEILIFKSGDFSHFLTEGEVKKTGKEKKMPTFENEYLINFN